MDVSCKYVCEFIDEDCPITTVARVPVASARSVVASIPGTHDGASKYFSYTERGAAEYAKRMYGAFPNEGSYTIIRTTINTADIPARSIMPYTADVVDGGVALPSETLGKLGRPRIMTGMSTGIGC